VHIIFLKALSTGPFPHHLTTAFSILLKLQLTPASLNHALVCMLPKDLSGLPKECRPISLTNVLRRLFEKILHPRLVDAVSPHMHPSQVGFRRHNSTLRPLQLADQSLKPYRILYDAMFAFDSPLFHILTAALADVGISRGLHRCIHYLIFVNLSSTLVANGIKSRVLKLY
jgi:hypothetical protein